MKTLYFIGMTLVAAIATGCIVYNNQDFFERRVGNVKNAANRTWQGARSTSGRVANAFSSSLHTERDVPANPAQA